jgi:hypothetical protein
MLSDSCHDFLDSITAAAAKLAAAVEHYAEPPFSYSAEGISSLREACEAVAVAMSGNIPSNQRDAVLALVTATYLTTKRLCMTAAHGWLRI